jgi:hypothetical protein
MNSNAELDTLRDALERLKTGQLGAQAFSQLARQQTLLAAALPPRFQEVLMQLLDRLESSALFSEESCSFSQHELHDSLALWIDKAGQRLIAS